MSIENPLPDVTAPSAETSGLIPGHTTVVAVVIEWRGKIALFKRSQHLHHDRGLWHCITGYLEPGVTPKQQALDELLEETGIHPTNLLDLRAGPDLVISDDDGQPWLVHTFTAVTSKRRLHIDWEHDSYRWTAPGKMKRFANRVAWLDLVLQAILPHSEPSISGREPPPES
jgi:8-oxo-dGTP pyrophosphatase MutT (NUDIX family)